MLFDPKWNIEDKEITLEAFAAWLGTKDPHARYRWLDEDNCPVSQCIS
jgi:hypothetical protein